MRSFAGIILLSMLTVGCSSSGLFNAQSSSSSAGARSSPDVTDRIADFFAAGAGTKPKQQPGDAPVPEDIDCPIVSVRDGASTLKVHAGREPTALNLRYQGTIGRTARECRVVAKAVQMKVGMEGHIILGPAGGPSNVEVPLRFALVREGPNPVTILTKTYRVPVAIDPGATNVPFLHIDDSLTFPLPPSAEIASYVIYIGFDPDAPKKRQPRRRTSRRKN